MKEEIDKAIDLCIEALNTSTDNFQQAMGSDADVLAVINKMAGSPYKGRNLGIGSSGHQGYRSSSRVF